MTPFISRQDGPVSIPFVARGIQRMPKQNAPELILEPNTAIVEGVPCKVFIMDHIWSAYSPDSTPAAMCACFTKRHGYPPDYIIRSGPSLLAGPIREDPAISREE
jgi:hypothetical protein